jgi:hypothetical protein
MILHGCADDNVFMFSICLKRLGALAVVAQAGLSTRASPVVSLDLRRFGVFGVDTYRAER